jgi:hypothetical protein
MQEVLSECDGEGTLKSKASAIERGGESEVHTGRHFGSYKT